jgi:hypothetical protein
VPIARRAHPHCVLEPQERLWLAEDAHAKVRPLAFHGRSFSRADDLPWRRPMVDVHQRLAAAILDINTRGDAQLCECYFKSYPGSMTTPEIIYKHAPRNLNWHTEY